LDGVRLPSSTGPETSLLVTKYVMRTHVGQRGAGLPRIAAQ